MKSDATAQTKLRRLIVVLYALLLLWCGVESRVERSTFCQEAKFSPEKSQILRQGVKKGTTIFSTFIGSYKIIWTRS